MTGTMWPLAYENPGSTPANGKICDWDPVGSLDSWDHRSAIMISPQILSHPRSFPKNYQGIQWDPPNSWWHIWQDRIILTSSPLKLWIWPPCLDCGLWNCEPHPLLSYSVVDEVWRLSAEFTELRHLDRDARRSAGSRPKQWASCLGGTVRSNIVWYYFSGNTASAGFRTKSRMIKGKRTLSKGALSQKSKVKSPKSRRVKDRNGKKSTVKKSWKKE